jgi:hypothetical protein
VADRYGDALRRVFADGDDNALCDPFADGHTVTGADDGADRDAHRHGGTGSH